jgi:teichuronic acid biosynthesis glycosyltransferase TuaG
MELVSIIIPYFKKQNFIYKCINSILSQTYKKFEIIIINDECSIISKKILKQIKSQDKRIKIINNKKNLGAGLSRNIGIKKSKGQFLAFIDADDTWHKDKLRYQIYFMKKNNFLFTYTSYFIINEKDKKIGKYKINKSIKYQNLLNSCDIGLSTVMINSKLKKQIKFSDLRTKEDYTLWLNLSKKYKMYGINKFYTNWRKLKDSLSSSIFSKLIDAFFVYYKFEKFNLLKSLFFVLNLSFSAIKKKYNQYFL